MQKDEVISWEDVNSCITAPNAEAFNIIYNDRIVGGVVVTINNDTNINLLDLIFIKSECNNLGIGYDVWKIIEAKYTNTKKWITITPYFEERNIHFYINKCGFNIVDFFNQNHIDPKVPRNRIPELNCYFKFEKIMN